MVNCLCLHEAAQRIRGEWDSMRLWRAPLGRLLTEEGRWPFHWERDWRGGGREGVLDVGRTGPSVRLVKTRSSTRPLNPSKSMLSSRWCDAAPITFKWSLLDPRTCDMGLVARWTRGWGALVGRAEAAGLGHQRALAPQPTQPRQRREHRPLARQRGRLSPDCTMCNVDDTAQQKVS